jgi:hypothetical protein
MYPVVMQDRTRRDPARGDYSADDFPDWNNPEDMDEDWEDAPEGYYDEDDEDDDGYIPGPDDPDFDLSEAAGYAGWEEPRSREIIPQWLIVLVSIALILAIIIPAIFVVR